jgi:endonuclease/exonuclease/phosphatase (EEP) superfamily protein YafD
VALATQAWAVLPYTPLHPQPALRAPSCAPESTVSLLAANVLYSNRDAQPLLEMVAELEPDLVLLSETDAWWDAALAPLTAAYAETVAQPQENHYGMHLFAALPLVDPQVRRLVEDEVPSILTGVTLPNGAVFDLYGLHPRPPPLSDTEERDAELLIVAEEVRARRRPAVVAGDLNDVAWSQSTRLFQHVSGLLDPRIGRGLYSTFHADWPGMRWPLDYVFFDEAFTLVDLRVLPSIGSDHFPLMVSLCLGGATAAAQEAPEPEAGDLEEAREAIEEGHRDEAEDEAAGED